MAELRGHFLFLLPFTHFSVKHLAPLKIFTLEYLVHREAQLALFIGEALKLQLKSCFLDTSNTAFYGAESKMVMGNILRSHK